MIVRSFACSLEINLSLVHLQPMKQDPPADFKCRDKFLVQSVPITADREAVNIQTIVFQPRIHAMEEID